MANDQLFKAVSNKQDFQEALTAAIKTASQELSKGGADILIRWRLDSIQGAVGGIAGVKDLTVTISANSD